MNQTSLGTDVLLDYWGMVVRRKVFIGLSIGLSLLVAWGLTLVLPKSYRSSTLIMVESQKIPERYVQGVVSGTLQERLSVIQQQVMSRTLLTSVIDEFHLYEDTRKAEGVESVIDAVRKDIKVETKGGGRVESFSISFAHGNPATAQKVTAKLASQFIEENLKIREQFVEGASEFLDQELQSASTALQAKEREMGQFKQRYMGELPGQVEANLRALDRLQVELASVEELLPKVRERLDVMDKAISNYDMSWAASIGSAAPLKGMPGPVITEDPQRARLRDLEQKLASLTAQYKDTYPDVVQLRREVDRLKARLGEAPNGSEPEVPKQQTTDKSSISRQKETVPTIGTDPYLQGLMKQRDDVRAELSTLKERERRLNAQIKDYEGRVERAPMREQELTILMRDYENMQKNYQSLLDKKLNARIAENLEKRQKGEQFRILDPANLPTKPEKPDPLKMILAGLVVGCGIGFGGAFLMEQSSKVFRRAEEIESELSLSVLATIPDFRMAYEATGAAGMLPAPRDKSLGEVPRGGQAVRPAITGHIIPARRAKKPLIDTWRRVPPRPYGTPTAPLTAAEAVKCELNLVAKWRPSSVVAEQYRVAATRLVLAGGGQKSTVVVVTSAVKGEGKSCTASNLAYVLAQDLGKKTVLVDCDFKCPTIHLYNGVPARPGVAEAILDGMSIEQCLHRSGEIPLSVLPASPNANRPMGLTKIPELNNIMTELRQQFEFIIVDAPPILPLADMNLLAGMADMLLIVVRSAVTSQDIVRKAIKALKPSARMGVILTAYAENNLPKYMRQYYIARTGLMAS